MKFSFSNNNISIPAYISKISLKDSSKIQEFSIDVSGIIYAYAQCTFCIASNNENQTLTIIALEILKAFFLLVKTFTKVIPNINKLTSFNIFSIVNI